MISYEFFVYKIIFHDFPVKVSFFLKITYKIMEIYKLKNKKHNFFKI